MGPVAAATVSADADADADARVAERHPNFNYGRASELAADAVPPEESYVRFKVAGTGGAVSRAVVRRYATDGSSDGPVIYPVSGLWDERRINWQNRPGRRATALADVAAVGGATSSSTSPRPSPGDGTYSFALVAASPDSTQFASREANKNRPRLLTTGVSTTTTSSSSSELVPRRLLGRLALRRWLQLLPRARRDRSFESTFASIYAWSRQRLKPIVIGEYGSPGRPEWTLLSETSAIDAFRRRRWTRTSALRTDHPVAGQGAGLDPRRSSPLYRYSRSRTTSRSPRA